MPKINWETYRKLIPDKKIVDDLKSDLEKYKVPYPEDTLTPKIEEQWKALQPEIEKFCAEQDKEIEKATKELNRVKALPKFEDMTMEMFYDFYPDEALDPVNRPTFWPHNPEEQPGYQTPEQKTMKKGGGH
ncbi:unnamed protein product [Parnassius apollo]|uniref:(apollo) hypothetical protein n=1 Tax=Parnassius apollo TaxID=110799 RepID=A0A8S3WDH3_PARAO|nr:unnamed protein product [Parnassius apollo]